MFAKLEHILLITGLLFCPTTLNAHVVELSDSSYARAITEKPHFVKFFAPWCKYCVRLAPIWEELATSLEADGDNNIVISQADCTTSSEFCSWAGVQGYPTLKFLWGDVEEEYEGGRTLDALRYYIAEVSSTLIKKNDGATAFSEKGLYKLSDQNFDKTAEIGFTFVKFFAPWCGHCKAMSPAWKNLALKFISHERVKIAEMDCTTNKNTCETNGIRGYPTMILFRDGEQLAKYENRRTVEKWSDFILEHLNEKEESTTETLDDQQDQSLLYVNDKTFTEALAGKTAFVSFCTSWSTGCAKLEQIWQDISIEVAITFAVIDCEESPETCSRLAVDSYPTILFLNDLIVAKKYMGSITEKEITQFVRFFSRKFGREVKDEL
eukprot:m.322590 g.322590  ORF g.322590 m.322590 type:complete len:380 (-) comp16533_c0_seq30:2532-3671(-)